MSDDELPREVAPPPPAELKQRLGGFAKVRTRKPWLSFAIVAILAMGWGALSLAVHPVRQDLPWLPVVWVGVVAGVWLLAFVLPLWRVMVPPRGQVLPDERTGELLAYFAAIAVTAVSVLWTRDAPGHSKVPEDFMIVAWHCLRFNLLICAGVAAVAVIALRKMIKLSSWRLGAAIGAAGGALGGLTLHFLCAYATPSHVAIGHAGGVIVGAALGALLVKVLSR
jgi:hypothetical protein